MSDFLSNLVTRSLTPGSDAIRPRLPSLFEPWHTVVDLALHAPTEVAPLRELGQLPEVSDYLPVDRQSGGVATIKERQRGEDEAAPARQVASTGWLPEAEPMMRPTIALPPNDLTPTPQRVETSEIAKTPEILPAAKQPLTIAVQPVLAESGATTERARQLSQLVPSLRQPLANGDVLNRGAATGKPLQEVVTSSSPVPLPSQQRPPAGRPPGALPPSTTHYQPPTSSPQPSDQTIQVTIGRIEVRATPPPAPARRPRTEPASTTLDEYLKRRASGDKR
jgi:hypothetical protein